MAQCMRKCKPTAGRESSTVGTLACTPTHSTASRLHLVLPWSSTFPHSSTTHPSPYHFPSPHEEADPPLPLKKFPSPPTKKFFNVPTYSSQTRAISSSKQKPQLLQCSLLNLLLLRCCYCCHTTKSLLLEWNARQCNALQQQQILEQTQSLCNPKEESKKNRENFILKNYARIKNPINPIANGAICDNNYNSIKIKNKK